MVRGRIRRGSCVVEELTEAASEPSPQSQTVTKACAEWGFFELGRTAGYYRELFGETPRETLLHDMDFHGLRLRDALQ